MNAHTALVKAILAVLETRRDLFCWGNNSGAFKLGTRFVRFGYAGSPDIIGLLSDGRFLGIEVKTGSGRLSPAQKVFRDRVSGLGGFYLEARAIDDVLEFLTGLKK